MIDGVPESGCIGDSRNGRPLHRLVCPVTFVDCAFRNPTSNRVLLYLRQVLVRGSRRHDIRALSENAPDDLAVAGISGNNRYTSRAHRPGRFFANVEPEVGLARRAVGTVAAEARIRHDGSNVAVEGRWAGLGRHFSDSCDADRDQAHKLTHDDDTYTPVGEGAKRSFDVDDYYCLSACCADAGAGPCSLLS